MSDLGHLHADNIYTASFPGFHTDSQVHHSEDMKTDKEHKAAEGADNMNKADITEVVGAAGVDRSEAGKVADRTEAGKAAGADMAEVAEVAVAAEVAEVAVAAEVDMAVADMAAAAAGKQGIANHPDQRNYLQDPEVAGILTQEGRNASVSQSQEKQTFSPRQIGLAVACSWHPISHRT